MPVGFSCILVKISVELREGAERHDFYGGPYRQATVLLDIMDDVGDFLPKDAFAFPLEILNGLRVTLFAPEVRFIQISEGINIVGEIVSELSS